MRPTLARFFMVILSTAFSACQELPSFSSNFTVSEGRACRHGEICLALKVVAYIEEGLPVAERSAIDTLMTQVNEIWSRCGIQFFVEEYQSVEAKNLGLPILTLYRSELPRIREILHSNNQLLVVLTTAWGNEGDINDNGADAWTTLPGNPPYGAIIDKPVSTHAAILAHEIGHYLNLGHVPARENLLSPVVTSKSRVLSDSQCSSARGMAKEYWPQMLR